MKGKLCFKRFAVDTAEAVLCEVTRNPKRQLVIDVGFAHFSECFLGAAD